ncbi:hypothetical protein V5E97_30170 [Singulisphaera sp. Ch08]|uniref:EF-hand domain-containing protein n=1 Tax=Singulisphaera sp. Ch08 TaxID=3120278 RepID=A0AAU7CBM8_9BACT
MSRLILASLSLIFAAMTAGPATAGDPLEFVVLGDDTLARIDMRIEVEGSLVSAVWDETFARLFSFFDGDGNGVIDEKEASRLPSPLALRKALGSGFTPPVGRAPAFGELDRDGDAKVTAGELAAFYRGKGTGDVIVGVGRLPGGARLTSALLKFLDPDGDGKVTQKDWGAAADDMGKLDANDDELIGAGELVSKLLYPGAAGTIQMKPPSSEATHSDVLGDLPLVLLPMDRKDTYWADEIARRKPGVKSVAPAEWRGCDADGHWIARLGETMDVGKFAFVGGHVRVSGWVAGGRLNESVSSSRQTMTTQFENPTNEPEDIAGNGRRRRGGNLLWLTPIADVNGDGKLDRMEFDAWLDLQSQIARGQVLLTILDGGGLFELLDASHDGALSTRELRTSWDRLKETGCVEEGLFDRARVPRVVLAAVSRGYPKSLSPEQRRSPAWAKAMDRNGDGDVSRREFTGTAEKFAQLDRDNDGLIDADEAAQATSGK